MDNRVQTTNYTVGSLTRHTGSSDIHLSDEQSSRTAPFAVCPFGGFENTALCDRVSLIFTVTSVMRYGCLFPYHTIFSLLSPTLVRCHRIGSGERNIFQDTNTRGEYTQYTYRGIRKIIPKTRQKRSENSNTKVLLITITNFSKGGSSHEPVTRSHNRDCHRCWITVARWLGNLYF
jgi:hypothetical protein